MVVVKRLMWHLLSKIAIKKICNYTSSSLLDKHYYLWTQGKIGWERQEGWEGHADTLDAVNPCSFLTQTWVYLPFSPQRLYLLSYSCKWALYTLYIVSIICSLSQNKVGFLHGDWSCLTCQQTDRIIALYWSPVISGCVIRNSAEFPYLEEEERQPQGKLRLWQEFIIAIARVYNNFVPAHTCSQEGKHAFSFACPCVHNELSPREFSTLWHCTWHWGIVCCFHCRKHNFILNGANYLEVWF